MFRQTHAVKRLHRPFFFFATEPSEQAAPSANSRQHAGHYIGQQGQTSHEIELLKNKSDLGANFSDIG